MNGREFSDIYLPLSDNFYRVALYLLENSDDAEDAVQDLYIKLWNSRDALDAVHNPGAYGITLLRNLCIDRIRSKGRRRREEVDDVVSDAAGADDTMAQKERLGCVMRALSRLPDKQREILRMKVVEDLSYEEIQKRTGISYISLRVMVSQARTKLKSSYEKD